MEVKCYQNEQRTKDYTIINNEKKLRIMYCGTLDLYMQLNSPNLKEELSSDTFEITKENYFIYSLFEQLYDDIRLCNLYQIDENDLLWCDTKEEIEALYSNTKRRNEELKNSIVYQSIFDGKSVIWYSDEYIHDEADILKITKEEDKYVLEFKEQRLPEPDSDRFRFPGSICIRFRNSGSYQQPFNCIFMRMYQKLQEYDPEYHQIHVEEYVYQKKLIKSKASDNN